MNARRLPVTLIGGYLGAGKTTLVNHLLRHADGRRLAVLVNEFGDLPIDGDLIEARDDNLISIAGGCICCSFGSDLVAALMAIKDRADIDQIVIETSGVALPGSVVQAMALLPGLDIDGVIVVADAETIEERSSDRYMSDTVLRQLAEADLVLLNKIDLVTEERRGQVASWLATQALRGKVLPVQHARIPIDVALGLQTDRRGARGSARPHDTSQYETFAVEVSGNAEVARLAQRLSDPHLGVLRAKGFVRDGLGQLQALQVVGNRVNVSPAQTSEAGAPRLVFIGLTGQLDRESILAVVADPTAATGGPQSRR
jgi:G3E family GTPase